MWVEKDSTVTNQVELDSTLIVSFEDEGLLQRLIAETISLMITFTVYSWLELEEG